MDVVGVQQVLSLSSTAEKVQQTAQQRSDIANYNALTSRHDEDVERSSANPPAELTQETRLLMDRERRERRQNRGKPVKKRSAADEENMESEETVPASDCGNILDIIV